VVTTADALAGGVTNTATITGTDGSGTTITSDPSTTMTPAQAPVPFTPEAVPPAPQPEPVPEPLAFTGGTTTPLDGGAVAAIVTGLLALWFSRRRRNGRPPFTPLAHGGRRS
jgi:hypothetical protein